MEGETMGDWEGREPLPPGMMVTTGTDEAVDSIHTNPHKDVRFMTVREYFAATAMAGLLSVHNDDTRGPRVTPEQYRSLIARLAVEYADELIAELNK